MNLLVLKEAEERSLDKLNKGINGQALHYADINHDLSAYYTVFEEDIKLAKNCFFKASTLELINLEMTSDPYSFFYWTSTICSAIISDHKPLINFCMGIKDTIGEPNHKFPKFYSYHFIRGCQKILSNDWASLGLDIQQLKKIGKRKRIAFAVANVFEGMRKKKHTKNLSRHHLFYEMS